MFLSIPRFFELIFETFFENVNGQSHVLRWKQEIQFVWSFQLIFKTRNIRRVWSLNNYWNQQYCIKSITSWTWTWPRMEREKVPVLILTNISIANRWYWILEKQSVSGSRHAWDKSSWRPFVRSSHVTHWPTQVTPFTSLCTILPIASQVCWWYILKVWIEKLFTTVHCVCWQQITRLTLLTGNQHYYITTDCAALL